MDGLQEAIKEHKEGQYKRALKKYHELAEKNHNHGDLHHLIGICLAQMEQFDQALIYLKKAANCHPDSPEILSNLGNVYKRLQHKTEAIKQYKKSLIMRPNNSSAHNNLASLYINQKCYKEAKTHLHQAIAQNHDFADAHYNLGLIYTEEKDYTKAQQSFEKATNYDENHNFAKKMLAQIYHHSNKVNKAIPLYNTFLKHHDDIDAKHALASCYLASNNESKALDLFREVLIREPKHPELHHNLASYFLTQHNYPEAIKHLLTHLSLHRNDINTLYNLGVSYHYTAKYSESDSYFQSVLKLEPNHFNTLVNLGALNLQKQDLKSAVNYYKSALKIKPSDTSIQFIINALSKNTKPSNMPKEYVVNLFNQYADYYDNHLTKVLDYQVPKRIEHILNEMAQPKEKTSILDLACGTGLLGPLLKEHTQELVGVDIAPNMIEKAKITKAYDKLHTVDVFEFLNKKHCFNWIIAAELLPYIHDIELLLKAIHFNLIESGHAIISTETHNDDSLVKLSTSARYQYNTSQLEKIITGLGFKIISSDAVNIRKQHSQSVKGQLLVLQK